MAGVVGVWLVWKECGWCGERGGSVAGVGEWSGYGGTWPSFWLLSLIEPATASESQLCSCQHITMAYTYYHGLYILPWSIHITMVYTYYHGLYILCTCIIALLYT